MRADLQLSRRAVDVMRPLSPEADAVWAGAAGDGAHNDYVRVPPDASLWEVIAKMRANGVSAVLVASNFSDVQGMITRENIVDTLADDMELFGG
jgi:CBS domain-containing protein